jgi:5'-nucleotidase
MRILVTNDDGIRAPGLWQLVKELQAVGQVVVAAPGEERSGSGTSISLRKPIEVTRIEPEVAGAEAYSVDGTPADAAIIAVKSLFPDEIDLVASGINRGSNMGHDVFVSGTVGAAMQGYLHGIPSLAVSMHAYEALTFAVAARLAALLAARVKDGTLPREVLLNVNVPNLELGEIAGLEITRLSRENYCDRVERDDGSGDGYYQILRNNEFIGDVGSDVWALRRNLISITALPDGRVSGSLQRRLRDMAPELCRELQCG